MTAGWVFALVLLLPTLLWGLVLAVFGVRRWLVRRAGADRSRARLRHLVTRARARGREVVTVPTWAVDLPVGEVTALAAEAGFELVGYEHSRGPLRRRIGVFLRSDGEIAGLIAAGKSQKEN